MATVRPIGFSNSLQQLVWPTTTSEITTYVWGAGGGGGGQAGAIYNGSYFQPGGPGGTGGGGGFAKKTFTINPGDILQVGVGGGGGAGGAGYQGGSTGGSAGPSYTVSTVWTTLNLTGYPYIRVTNGAYCGFLNTYGTWNYTDSAGDFDHTVSVYFPSSGYYSITGSCDNYASILVDGVSVLYTPGFQTTYSNSFYVSAGNHSLRLLGVNLGGPASLGVTITGGGSFGGGRGGDAVPGGAAASGGGAGGASVVLLNGAPIAVAGGGGGGGGGQLQAGANAPGTSGQTSPGTYAGQNGNSGGGAGTLPPGGSGAGGGGYAGGNGGTYGIARDGSAGYYGSSLGDVVANPSGQVAGGTDQPYYSASIGLGGGSSGAGRSGYVVLDMAVGGASIKYNNAWAGVQKTYIKSAGAWQAVQATYVKNNGVWAPINGSFAPSFTTVSGFWGTDPRSY